MLTRHNHCAKLFKYVHYYVKVIQSCPTLHSPWSSLGQNTGVGSCFLLQGCSLLQGIFPTQESSPGLLHCRQILYYLSYQGSPYFFKISG